MKQKMTQSQRFFALGIDQQTKKKKKNPPRNNVHAKWFPFVIEHCNAISCVVLFHFFISLFLTSPNDWVTLIFSIPFSFVRRIWAFIFFIVVIPMHLYGVYLCICMRVFRVYVLGISIERMSFPNWSKYQKPISAFYSREIKRSTKKTADTFKGGMSYNTNYSFSICICIKMRNKFGWNWSERAQSKVNKRKIEWETPKHTHKYVDA